MNILVTGSTGFIGSAIVRELINDGREVKALVRKGTNMANINGLDIESHRIALLHKMNFISPYIELPKKLTVKQNLIVYGKLYNVKNINNRIANKWINFQLINLILIEEQVNNKRDKHQKLDNEFILKIATRRKNKLKL